MYGGLFGDLPSAKSSEKKDDEEKTEKRVQVPPDEEAPNATVKGQDKKPTVLSVLGNAGTSMAFLPTALRPRKRPKPSTTSTKLKATQIPITKPPAPVVEPKATAVKEEVVAEEGKVEQEDYIAVPKEVRIKREEPDPVVIENIHEALDGQGPRRDEPSLEDEKLQKLHASVADPYDPHVPNDLLAYRERKTIEQGRLALEREARETLERQQRLRQQLEEERQRVQESGRASEIIEHHAKMSLISRGRGRGVSNLPAWLLQKQKDELGTIPPDNVSIRTVVLSNLTAPGEIDVALGQEVQEECEDKCGPVQRVQVKDAQPPSEPEVQVWVQFQTVGDAKKAAELFHGRLFGQRRITARQQSG
jgi:hypothetical protein